MGNVAPLRAQPTMLKTVCVYILGLNSPVTDLMTLIAKSPYWLRNVGRSLCVLCHAGVTASQNTQNFLFSPPSSRCRREMLAFTKKRFRLVLPPHHLCHQEYCNFKVACSTLVIPEMSMYHPLKLFVRNALFMKPGGVSSCVYPLKFK